VEQAEAVIARQQHGKQVSAAANQHTTTEELLEAVFSSQSIQRLHEDQQLQLVSL
jgi:3-hydroxyacyl-CoA dehydrogenase